MKVTLLTGGSDKPYAFGMLNAMLNNGIEVDFIGSDELNDQAVVNKKGVNFLNYRGNQDAGATVPQKIVRVMNYYRRLFYYTYKTNSNIYHILWLNKFYVFDRTLLNIYYKIMGKKIVFTAHNINQDERDGKKSLINNLSLKFMYNYVDHIYVHTNMMKMELINKYGVKDKKITVIKFGINDTVPNTNLSSCEAKSKLKITKDDKILLFFGRIAPYKGLDILISALEILVKIDNTYKLIIAGPIKMKECSEYWKYIENAILSFDLKNNIIQSVYFIPDEDVEIYFKAADVLILPYKNIFQSGLIFLSYYFGLPIIASDIASFSEDIVIGETGYLFKTEDPTDLALKISNYYNGTMYKTIKPYKK